MAPREASLQEGRYGARTAVSTNQHFSDISADVQKFRSALAKVRASHPTGVQECEVYAMAVAIHFGKTNKMEYVYKDYDSEKHWCNFKAWLVLREHPKWADAVDGEDVSLSQTSGRDVSSTIDAGGSVETTGTEGANAIEIIGEGITQSKPIVRYPTGVKAAKSARQEEVRTASVRALADAAKRKSDMLEERNAIAIFSRPDMSGTPEAKEFFEEIGRVHLARAKKRARVIEREEENLTTAEPSQPPATSQNPPEDA